MKKADKRHNQKTMYLTNEELADALAESQQAGQPTVRVCNCFKLIATHLLGSPKYRRYPKCLQEDMTSAALVKCIKNIKNYKPERASNCFNYYTRCTEHAFWEVLGKHYRQINIRRELVMQYAEQIETISPKTAKLIRDSQIEIGED